MKIEMLEPDHLGLNSGCVTHCDLEQDSSSLYLNLPINKMEIINLGHRNESIC
jgi:hypothetical protein